MNKKDFNKLTKTEKAITIFCFLLVGLIIAGLIYMRVNAKPSSTSIQSVPEQALPNTVETKPVVTEATIQQENQSQPAEPKIIQLQTTQEQEVIKQPQSDPVIFPVCNVELTVGTKCKTDNSTPWSDLLATMLVVNADNSYKVSVTQADNPNVGISPEYVELNLGVKQ